MKINEWRISKLQIYIDQFQYGCGHVFYDITFIVNVQCRPNFLKKHHMHDLL